MLGAAAASQKTRATTRVTTTASPSSKILVSRNCAVPRFQRPWSSATNAHGTFPMPRALHITFSMLKYCHTAFTPKFVCVRLRVATAIWRTVIHCYCMIILLTQYVGLVWNSLHIYLSVIWQRPIRYLIYHSDGWTQTVTPEFIYINLPHTSNAYSSWSVYIFAYQISETDRYLPLLSIPGAGNIVAVADPAVITNFRLQPKFSPGSHIFRTGPIWKHIFFRSFWDYTTKSVKAFRRYRHLKLPTHTHFRTKTQL